MPKTDRTWLKQFGQAVVRRLYDSPTIPADLLIAASDIRTEITNTGGWYAELARLPKTRGDRLQIWFDDYTKSDGRRVNLCYKTTRPDRARKLLAAKVVSVSEARRVDDSFYVSRGPDNCRMAQALAPSSFRKPFAELYERRDAWSFIGIYLPQRVDCNRTPPSGLVNEAVDWFAPLLRSIMVHHHTSEADVAYPEAGRSKVRRHLTRERAGRLVELAKMRDEYTCQVCGINFQQLYGSLGKGFVEAHHRIPLSSPKAARRTRPKHLVAVCANCHRMLHRLSPKVDGLPALRKRLTKEWPA